MGGRLILDHSVAHSLTLVAVDPMSYWGFPDLDTVLIKSLFSVCNSAMKGLEQLSLQIETTAPRQRPDAFDSSKELRCRGDRPPPTGLRALSAATTEAHSGVAATPLASMGDVLRAGIYAAL